MKKVNILFISNGVSKTGAPKMLELLLNYIKTNKADKYTVYVSSILMPDMKSEDREYWEKTYNCFFIRSIQCVDTIKSSEMPIIFKSIEFDVVYGNCISALPYLYIAKKCNSNINTILHLHEYTNGFQMINMQFGEYTNCLFKSVDKFITVCKLQISELQKYNISLKNILHIPEMIDVNIIDTLISSNSVVDTKSKIKVIGCGTGGTRKGIDRFIDISNRFDPNVYEFIWFGDVPVENNKINLEGHGIFEDIKVDIGNVNFIGQVDVPARYFAHSNIFLMLSRQDPCPLVVLEALYKGMFVVTLEDSGDSHVYCTPHDEILKTYNVNDVISSINRLTQKRCDSDIVREKVNYHKILRNIVSPEIIAPNIINFIDDCIKYKNIQLDNFNEFEGENNSVIWTKDVSKIVLNKSSKSLEIKIKNTLQITGEVQFVFDNVSKSIFLHPLTIHQDFKFDVTDVTCVTIISKTQKCPTDARSLGLHIISMKVDGIIIDRDINKVKTYDHEYHDENINEFRFDKFDKIVFACIAGTSGYGVLARETVLNLRHLGYKVNYLPFPFEKSLNEHNNELIINDFNESDATCYILNFPPHVLNYVYTDLLKNKCKGKKVISFPLWESEYMKREYIDRINKYSSSVIASSEWNKHTMRKCGVVKDIQVLYHKPILPPLRSKNEVVEFVYKNSKLFGKPKDLKQTKNFYSIGQWTCRKGITEVIESFCQAFTNADNVTLILKTYYAAHDNANVQICVDRINKILKNHVSHPTIYYIYSNLCDDDMNNIHFCGDVYVSATKSEGIGLGAITASGYNKPVIITKYGAQYEYLKNDPKAMFVSYKLYPAKDDLSFNLDLTNQLWSHPDIPDMVNKMRTVYKQL